MSRKHMGSSIDDFLKEEGIFEKAQAIKEVVAWQLGEAMKKMKISKNKMAVLLKTNRSQVDRLLDPKNDITLSSLQRAAATASSRPPAFALSDLPPLLSSQADDRREIATVVCHFRVESRQRPRIEGFPFPSCPMPQARYPVPPAPCPVRCALCPVRCAPCPVLCALCPVPPAPCPLRGPPIVSTIKRPGGVLPPGLLCFPSSSLLPSRPPAIQPGGQNNRPTLLPRSRPIRIISPRRSQRAQR
jgi:antitoxin HicB